MRPVRGGAAEVVVVAPAAAAGSGHGNPGAWRTPTPYLFLGFAVMTVLLAAALLVLFCTRRKPGSGWSSRRGSSAAADDQEDARRALSPLDREPKLVVIIMAGHDAPYFLACARPLPVVPPLSFTTADVEPRKVVDAD